MPTKKQNNQTMRFFVPGVPATAGSKSYKGRSSKTGRAIIVDSDKRSRPWKDSIIASFLADQKEHGWVIYPPKTALQVQFEFYLPRPKGHYGSGKNEGMLKERFKYARHTVKPDVLKLARCAEDALTGFAYHDDADTVSLILWKRYADPEFGRHAGVQVTIRAV